jgi:hypothetical protein
VEHDRLGRSELHVWRQLKYYQITHASPFASVFPGLDRGSKINHFSRGIRGDNRPSSFMEPAVPIISCKPADTTTMLEIGRSALPA